MQLMQDRVRGPCCARGREQRLKRPLEVPADGPVKPKQDN